jgi:uncharacterized protein YbjT (DUF2867 family)
MKVLVAGAAGNTGRRIVRLLAQGGHEVRALARKREQLPGLTDLGAEALQVDLEHDADRKILDSVRGCDAVFFAAGAGPGSGAARKKTVDYGAAVKLVDAARAAGAERYVMLSAMNLSDPGGAGKMEPYLLAKVRADVYLQASDLSYTIVRPGRLNDGVGSGRIDAAPQLGRYGEISREDVAATMVACLAVEDTRRRTFEVLAGSTPIREALEGV